MPRMPSDDDVSVAPSKGVSDITGVELGSVYSDTHQVPDTRYPGRPPARGIRCSAEP